MIGDDDSEDKDSWHPVHFKLIYLLHLREWSFRLDCLRNCCEQNSQWYLMPRCSAIMWYFNEFSNLYVCLQWIQGYLTSSFLLTSWYFLMWCFKRRCLGNSDPQYWHSNFTPRCFACLCFVSVALCLNLSLQRSQGNIVSALSPFSWLFRMCKLNHLCFENSSPQCVQVYFTSLCFAFVCFFK